MPERTPYAEMQRAGGPSRPATARVLLVLLALASSACVHHQAQAAQALPTVWDRQVRNARDAGDGDYALRMLREKVAAEPDDIPVRLELVKAYQDRGYPDLAIELCRLTAARFPESADVQLALVRALHGIGRDSDAIAGVEAFLRTHPQSGPDFASWLGILHDEAGQFADAEPAHRQALQAAPDSDSLHNNLGYNLLLQKKYQPAADEFETALKLNPHSAVAHNNLGVALANLDQPDRALASWQAVSDAATAHNNLAAVLMEKGEFPQARHELELALSYNKNHAAALKNLELVSRLDGQPAAVALKPDLPLWKRVVSGLVWVMGGGPDNPRTDSPSPAAAPPGGEKP